MSKMVDGVEAAIFEHTEIEVGVGVRSLCVCASARPHVIRRLASFDGYVELLVKP